jgi:hypothetical protein
LAHAVDAISLAGGPSKSAKVSHAAVLVQKSMGVPGAHVSNANDEARVVDAEG